MKNKIIQLLMAVSIILNVLISACFDNMRENTQNSTYKTESSYKYCVQDYSGKIAVFKYGSNSPLEVFDKYTGDFPISDQQLLYEGIKAKNEYELENIIEDYIS